MANRNSIYDMSTTALTNDNIAGISLAENVTKPSDVNNVMREQEAQAIRFANDLGAANTVTGTANAPTVTLSSNTTTIVDGMRFTFSAVGANTTAVTATVKNSAGATLATANIKKWSSGSATDLSANDIPGASALVDVIYKSSPAAFMIVSSSGGLAAATNAQAATATSTTVALTPANLAQERGYSNDPFINLSLVASVATSALTVAIKGVDGNDPSAANPVVINFRSATATSGAVAQLTLTAATSIVVSSGSTLGSTSAVATTYAIVVFNDAGTARIGIINPLLFPLVDTIASSTAEGGSGGADSAGVFYTGIAATSKAYTVIGFITATEATAGTWATAPSTVQVGAAAAVNNSYGSTGTTTPTVTSSSGAFTTVSCTLNYTKIGNRVLFDADVLVTTVGTASGEMNVPLPFTIGPPGAVFGQISATGVGLSCRLTSGATALAAARYDGAAVITTGHFYFSGQYRV